MRGGARSVLVRGIRWRLMGSLLVVITAAIAVGAAIVGPLFLRAGGDSLVRQAVAGASVIDTRFELVRVGGAVTLDGVAAERRSLLASGHLSGLYGPPVVQTMFTRVLLNSMNGNPYASRLTYRTGICSILHFSTGGCRTGLRGAVVSNRTARRLGISVGSTITVNDFKNEHPVRIRITGVFDLRNLQSAYWFGDPGPYFPFGQTTAQPPARAQLSRGRRSIRGQPGRLRAPLLLRALIHHPERVAVRRAGHRECVGRQAGHARAGAARRGRRFRGRNRSSRPCSRARYISRA